MKDQEPFDRKDDLAQEPGAGGIEYIGNQPIKGPLIGADQPVVDNAATGASGNTEESNDIDLSDTEPRPSEEDALNWLTE